MLRVLDQPAFVLHQRPYRDTSALLEVLTRDHGRVGVVARGVRSERTRFPRAWLSPFVPLRMAFSGRGELANMGALEATGAAAALTGQALMSGLYVNELLVRLLPRQDPHPELFGRYAVLLEELAASVDLAWTLRRFERDLLSALGFAPLLDRVSGHAEPVVADAEYSYDPERGPVPYAERAVPPRISGSALLALASDQAPGPALQRELKQMMRTLLRHHLGGRELNAWRSFRG